jgi:hypothetical protein
MDVVPGTKTALLEARAGGPLEGLRAMLCDAPFQPACHPLIVRWDFVDQELTPKHRTITLSEGVEGTNNMNAVYDLIR